ncbi:MAG: chloride channel protein [Candidatus Binatia bacterium]
MADHDVSRASTTEGLPVAPSLGVTLQLEQLPKSFPSLDRRVVLLSGLAIFVAVIASILAQGLVALIGLITNVSFYGRVSADFVSPADHHLGPLVVLVPIVGGLIVGVMARYGSHAIRGHGIPEAMEQVLINQSRIPPRLTFLKPLSAAISIGTGGPFGAEGPIIATGGALGSLFGQLLQTTADERKVLLAAGAAAGMTATFGSPVSAVLLAVELLLFEFRPRSLIPVALASTTAAGMRIMLVGPRVIFPMPNLALPNGAALSAYVLIGGVVGIASVYVTRAVYAIEDGFARLPLHWMWWPAIGGVAVGVIGYWAPYTMGVGYDNIGAILSGALSSQALALLCGLKFVSWAIALGSGTSGGTLAPLFTLGGALGALLGIGTVLVYPPLGIDPRMAALVGMAAIFAGASRAMLASTVFAFETTLQPFGLLPLLGGCTAAYLVSCLLMRHSIMTEKIARRGIRVPTDYVSDILTQTLVREFASRDVVMLEANETLDRLRLWLNSGAPGSGHQGFPVVNAAGNLVGVVTRRDIYDLRQPPHLRVSDVLTRPPLVIYEDNSLREAADLMVQANVGRLPVVTQATPHTVVGIITRSDLLAAHRRRLAEAYTLQRGIRFGGKYRSRRTPQETEETVPKR